MVATAINWIKQKYEALRRKYQAKYQDIKQAILSPAKTPEPESPAAAARRKLGEAIDSLPDHFAKLANSFSKNAQLKRFIDVGADFMKSGHSAGLWGIREPKIGELAEMHVRITKSLIDEECESNQRKLSSQVKILETIKDNAEREYNNKNAYYEKLNRAYQYNQRQFSLILGVIYGFFAVVLVLADIPLALELTKRGFNLKSDPNNAIRDLFLLGTQEGIVVHVFRVLASNWEVVLFATGVAFCTIYIKIFYDDFVGVPLENLIKKASESPTADYEEFHRTPIEQASNDGAAATSKEANNKKEISARFNRLWWSRFFVKLFVLIVLLSTIVALGYFRYKTVTANTYKAIPGSATLLTFCLMTLIFPIVSGICGSLSLSSFHNWSARRKAGKQRSDARKALIKATDEYRVKLEEEERNSGFINWLADSQTIDQLRNYLIRCYESGFKFGYLYPEWTYGGDLFTRAEALRNRNLTDPNIPLNAFKFLNSDQETHAAVN